MLMVDVNEYKFMGKKNYSFMLSLQLLRSEHDVSFIVQRGGGREN